MPPGVAFCMELFGSWSPSACNQTGLTSQRHGQPDDGQWKHCAFETDPPSSPLLVCITGGSSDSPFDTPTLRWSCRDLRRHISGLRRFTAWFEWQGSAPEKNIPTKSRARTRSRPADGLPRKPCLACVSFFPNPFHSAVIVREPWSAQGCSRTHETGCFYGEIRENPSLGTVGRPAQPQALPTVRRDMELQRRFH